MVRVAIHLYGFLRTWPVVKQNFIKYLCAGIAPDIYIHAYTEDFQFDKYEAQGILNHDIVYTPEQLMVHFSDLNVKGLEIETRSAVMPAVYADAMQYSHVSSFWARAEDQQNSTNFDVSIAIKLPRGLTIIDQLRAIERSFLLRQQYCQQHPDVHYDIVVKARFDLMYHHTLNWQDPLLRDGRIHYSWEAQEDCLSMGTPAAMDNCIFRRYSQLPRLFPRQLTDSATVDPDVLDTHGAIFPENVGGCRACKRTVPCCELCAHQTIYHLLSAHGVRYGCRIMHATMIRSATTCHRPCHGGTVEIPLEYRQRL